MSDDLISRQAAIEEVERYLKRLEDKIGTSDDSEMFAHERGLLVGLKFDIDNIPSAQSEIIRCKDCKYRDDDFCTGRGWPMQLVPDDGFCDKGKRRTDE